MLRDTKRTEWYRDAILDNEELFKDKIVLDLGAGSGILSMLAYKAGAKEIHALEPAEIFFVLRKNVYDNKMEGKIFCHKRMVEDFAEENPKFKCDIIVSEWMGYFLVYERMIDSVIFARDRLLNEGGLMLPDKATMYAKPFCDEAAHNKFFNFWDDLYDTGIKMPSAKAY